MQRPPEITPCPFCDGVGYVQEDMPKWPDPERLRRRGLRAVSPVAPFAIAACVWGAVLTAVWPLWFLAVLIGISEWRRFNGK